MAQGNKELVRRFYQRLNAGDLCDFFRVDGGSLVEHWGVTDAAGMQHQLSSP